MEEVDIRSIFQRILVNVGLVRSREAIGVTDGSNISVGVQERVDAVISVEKQRFCCLFTLDMSSSMSGTPWTQVCESVSEFVRTLGNEDLVGAVVFNTNPSLVLSQSQQVSRDPQVSGNEITIEL